MSPAQITVAIVSWNTRDLLDRCLDSLYQDSQVGRADVWVIDNASSDRSAELVRDRYPWVRLIASRENLGFGRGVNAIAARTDSPWLALANADVRLCPGALPQLLTEGERHPEAGVIAPRLTLPDGSTQQSVYPLPTIPFTLAYAFGLTTLSRRLARRWCIDRGFDPSTAREVGWAVGAFLLVRRRAWRQVGGFDEAQWMYAEDVDLGWRLHRAGWITRYEPRARVLHHESAATSLAWGDTRHARWHASTYAWLMRRRGLALARAVALINVVGFSLRAVWYLPASLAGNCKARNAQRRALATVRAHTVGLRPRSWLERIR